MRHEPQVFLGLFASQSFLGVLPEKADDEILYQRGKLAEILIFKLDFLADDIFNRVAVVLIFKGCIASNQLVEGYSHSPAIDLFRVTASQEHFRRLIDTRPCIRKHLLVPAPQLHILADSEIDDFKAALLYIAKDVWRFDITVTYALFVDVSQRIQDFVEDKAQGILIHIWLKGREGSILHDQVAQPHLGVQIERLVFDYVTMFQLSNIDEVGLDGLVVLVLHLQDLHRKHLPVLTVDASLHHTVCPLAQLFLQLVDLLEGVFSIAVFEAFGKGRLGDLRIRCLRNGSHPMRSCARHCIF